MRYDAVLFDLDGTLSASAPGIHGSVRYTMEQMGFQLMDQSTLERFVGPPLFDSFQRYAGMTREESEKAVAVYRAHYMENGVLDTQIYQGIPNLLRQLKDEGVYLAVATAKPTGSARRVLEHFGLMRFFDRVVGADLERREDSKVSLLRDALPARYTRAAMVGDRSFDMQATKDLGITAIGAGWGYGSEEELVSTGADVYAATVRDAMYALLDTPVPPKGFFISIEGLDGSGKTTQMNAVAAHIRRRGYDVMETREPGGTPISEEIRELVLDPAKTVCAETEALLYAAARAQHVRDKVRPAIDKGRVVLCDRFVDASIVYQGAGRELGMEKVMAINAFAIGNTMPDLTLLFMVDAQTGLLRRASATKLDRIERAGEAFFSRVYDGYVAIAAAAPERVRCIDARRSIEQVTKEACQQVDRLLATR